MGLIEQIADGTGEFLLFALTPPGSTSAGLRAQEIADATLARLRTLHLDGLILYDIADEAARNPAERPFAFMPTLDPAAFLADNLTSWAAPVIVYRAVGKYSRAELRTWLAAQDPSRVMTAAAGRVASPARRTFSPRGRAFAIHLRSSALAMRPTHDIANEPKRCRCRPTAASPSSTRS